MKNAIKIIGMSFMMAAPFTVHATDQASYNQPAEKMAEVAVKLYGEKMVNRVQMGFDLPTSSNRVLATISAGAGDGHIDSATIKTYGLNARYAYALDQYTNIGVTLGYFAGKSDTFDYADDVCTHSSDRIDGVILEAGGRIMANQHIGVDVSIARTMTFLPNNVRNSDTEMSVGLIFRF